MKKEKIKEQMEIVNGDSREAIVDLIDSNPSLCSKAQVAIIELKDNKLTEKLMSSQKVIRDEAIIKIFMMIIAICTTLCRRTCCRSCIQRPSERICGSGVQ